MKTLLGLGVLALSFTTFAQSHYAYQMKTIKNPQIGENGVYARIAAGSRNSAKGVCKALGYSSAVPNSIIQSSDHGYGLFFDDSGNLVDGKSGYYFAKEVTCLNFQGTSAQRLVVIDRPTFPGTETRYAAGQSEANGICINLGFDGGRGALQDSNHGTGLSVDFNGEILGMKQGYYYVKKVTCYSNSGFVNQLPIYDHQSNYPLSYNYGTRAAEIADTVIEVSKAIEPYINNQEERQIDDLKKVAVRLKAQIESGRSINHVKSTLDQLELKLVDSEYFIDKHLETDNLDRLAMKLLTAREYLLSMIDFIDADYTQDMGPLY